MAAWFALVNCHHNYVILFCTATNPEADYVTVVGMMLTFNATVTQQCVNIPIVDDMAVEEPAETFVVTISTNDSSVAIPNPSATVSIMDNDGEHISSGTETSILYSSRQRK